MSLREKFRNPFVQQYAIEILFPILGFYFFDWSLIIIATFYLLDQLSSEVVYFRRLVWINNHQEDKKHPIFILEPILVFVTLFTIEILAIIYLWIVKVEDWSDFLDTLLQFTINELWFLFPMVLALYYVKDLFSFYMPRRYLVHNLRGTMNYHYLFNLAMLIGIVLFLLLITKTEINDHLILFLFIAAKLLYDFTVVRWCEKKGLKEEAT
jgi:hypothetical protein